MLIPAIRLIICSNPKRPMLFVYICLNVLTFVDDRLRGRLVRFENHLLSILLLHDIVRTIHPRHFAPNHMTLLRRMLFDLPLSVSLFDITRWGLSEVF
jgi:hypothetical protein